MEKLSMREIIFVGSLPVVSFLLRIFISRLFPSEKLTEPTFPFDGVPYIAPWKRLYCTSSYTTVPSACVTGFI